MQLEDTMNSLHAGPPSLGNARAIDKLLVVFIRVPPGRLNMS